MFFFLSFINHFATNIPLSVTSGLHYFFNLILEFLFFNVSSKFEIFFIYFILSYFYIFIFFIIFQNRYFLISLQHFLKNFVTTFSTIGRCRGDFQASFPPPPSKTSRDVHSDDDGSDEDDDDQPMKSDLTNLRDIIDSDSD